MPERVKIDVELPVEFAQLISELREWGMSYNLIAGFCGCTPEALRKCVQRRNELGYSVRFETGVRLVALHAASKKRRAVEVAR